MKKFSFNLLAPICLLLLVSLCSSEPGAPPPLRSDVALADDGVVYSLRRRANSSTTLDFPRVLKKKKKKAKSAVRTTQEPSSQPTPSCAAIIC